MPAVSVRSLIATGTPCRGPSFARFFTARSASRAQAGFFRSDEPRDLDGGEMSQLVRHLQDPVSAGMIYRFSTFAPERRMMSAHFPVSARTNAANRSGITGRAPVAGV